jgi:hypothetical protein
MKVARQFIAWYRCENRSRPGGYGMIGSDRRATLRTSNQPGLGIRPCPTGRILLGRFPGNKLPGYHHLVPSGQQPLLKPVHIFETTSLRVAGFEDSLSDEALALCCRPLKSASQARRAPQPGRGRSRKDEATAYRQPTRGRLMHSGKDCTHNYSGPWRTQIHRDLF